MSRACALDPSTSRDECAYVAVEERGDVWHLAAAKTWQGRMGAPLDIRNKVSPEAARATKALGCDSLMSDLYMSADVELTCQEHGLLYRRDEAELLGSFGWMRNLARLRRVWLRSSDPDLDAAGLQIASEIRGITLLRKGGKAQIVLPRAKGKHADLARAWIRALWHANNGGASNSKHNYDVGYGRVGVLGTGLAGRMVR